MKTPFRGHFKGALALVRSTRARSLSTVTGVVIGVASVVTIVSIGQGIKNQVAHQINTYGKSVITVRPGTINRQDNGLFGSGVFGGVQIGGSLSNQDLQTVKKTPGVTEAIPLKAVSGTVTGDNNAQYNGLVIATGAKFADILNQKVEYGSFFSDVDAGRAVIGANVAQALFQDDVPLGHSIKLRGQDFVIGGILAKTSSAPLSPDADFNNAIFIPLQAASDLSNNSAPTYEILAGTSSKDTNATRKIAKRVQDNLVKAHGGEQDVTALAQADSAGATNHILDLLTLLVSGVAAISLIVGGIGIMNVMLVTVTERMHEIGVRKAVGATNRQILNQFIVESAVLSSIGGILGIILSLLINLLLLLLTGLQPSISWQIMIIAAVVSVATGIIFGSIPALKAARKDPIDALRNM